MASACLIKQMPSRDSKTVTFRVSGAALQRLDREAEELGISRSERASQIARAHLQNEFDREILAGMHQALGALHGLREDVERTLVSVIDTLQTDPVSGTKRYSTDEVQAMVRRYLGPR